MCFELEQVNPKSHRLQDGSRVAHLEIERTEMKEAEGQPLVSPPNALFKLDLGANGGAFAPTSAADMLTWVQKELEFWSWSQNVHTGSHKGAIDYAIQPLHAAIVHARDAANLHSQNQTSAVLERVQHVQANVRDAFITRGLPHSSTPLAQRVAGLAADPATAVAYLLPFLPIVPGTSHSFDARDTSSWRGFLMGLLERFNIVKDAEPAIEAERKALDDLRTRAEDLLGSQRAVADQLIQAFSEAKDAIATAHEVQRKRFGEFLEFSESAQRDALEKHTQEMLALRRSFREEMTLRGPVEYWQTKATSHETKAKDLMLWMFGSMAGLAGVIGLLAIWVFTTLDDKGHPDAWKMAILILLAVMGVWAVRLVVRMFLSHTHLATDAEERVTMVKTYLSLLEADKMPSDDDRKLVLAPLFRPATDGLIKDEGLPHPMLEMLTRTGQR